MTHTRTYQVRGMTCGHCADAVTTEIREIPTVTGVAVDVVPQGHSSVTVSSAAGLDDDAVREAVARAGYDVVGTTTR